jgi:hypothetical protein
LFARLPDQQRPGRPARAKRPSILRFSGLSILGVTIALLAGMSRDSDIRSRACTASWYLLMRGDTRGGNDLAGRLHRQ